MCIPSLIAFLKHDDLEGSRRSLGGVAKQAAKQAAKDAAKQDARHLANRAPKQTAREKERVCKCQRADALNRYSSIYVNVFASVPRQHIQVVMRSCNCICIYIYYIVICILFIDISN